MRPGLPVLSGALTRPGRRRAPRSHEEEGVGTRSRGGGPPSRAREATRGGLPVAGRVKRPARRCVRTRLSAWKPLHRVRARESELAVREALGGRSRALGLLVGQPTEAIALDVLGRAARRDAPRPAARRAARRPAPRRRRRPPRRPTCPRRAQRPGAPRRTRSAPSPPPRPSGAGVRRLRRVGPGSGCARALVARVHRLARAARLAGVRAPDRVARLGLRPACSAVSPSGVSSSPMPGGAGVRRRRRATALARRVEDQEGHERRPRRAGPRSGG